MANTKRKQRLWRRVIALALTASLSASMGAPAFAEVEHEPDWNEAGDRLNGYIEEYADDPLFLEFLLNFQAANMEHLTGEFDGVLPDEDTEEVRDFPEILPIPDMGEGTISGISALGSGERAIAETASFVVPMNAATWGTTPDGFHWMFSSNTMFITGHNNPRFSGRLEIPQSVVVNGVRRNVTVIAEEAFANAHRLSNITSVVIPNTVREIRSGAFYATNLSALEIPASVDTIFVEAFSNIPSLRTVTFRGTTPPVFTWLNSFRVFTGTTGITSIRAPMGTLQAHHTALVMSSGLPVTASRRYIGFCRISTNTNTERCSCCAFRIGDVNGDGRIMSANTLPLAQNDAQQILNYLVGSSSDILRNGNYNMNSFNAAQVTQVSRNGNRVRIQDAQQILRYANAGMCTWIRGNQCGSSSCSCGPNS
jgi:hypothetical protein